ncbi:MAG TPA: hypothetical protein VFU31_07845 [Candidatus Binatia bacterium]|nr:hypothetical protein [Candidatus Binatia bacterium]
MTHTHGKCPRLHEALLLHALLLWKAGKNTAEIAKDLRGSIKHEAEVYNSLAAERERRRSIAA